MSEDDGGFKPDPELDDRIRRARWQPIGRLVFHPNDAGLPGGRGLVSFVLTPDPTTTTPAEFVVALETLRSFVASGQFVDGIDRAARHVLALADTPGRPQ